MKHPAVLVLGYSEAAMYLRRRERSDVSAIIAIHGQREFPVETDGVPHSLVLQFDDCEAPSPTDLLQASMARIQQRDAAELGLILTPPTVDHAKAIIDFAASIREMEGTVLCQCQAGISRSSAAALLCLAAWTGPGQEAYAVAELLSVRPAALPHLDLVGFGDELLGRDGKLIQALRRTQPS